MVALKDNLEKWFFEVLQVAIGTRGSLSQTLTAEEWCEVRLEFKRQALLGLGYVGITCLPEEQRPAIEQLVQWVYDAEKISKKNKEVTATCEEVTKQLERDGLGCCVLKGQGNLVNYPDNLRAYRTPGDIDLWAYPKDKNSPDVIDYALAILKRANSPKPDVSFSHINVDGVWPVSVEIHHQPMYLSNPFANHRFKRWYKEQMSVCSRMAEVDGHTFPVATNDFNVIYQLVHVYRHLHCEGVGLRQLVDYYFVLRSVGVSNGFKGFSDGLEIIRLLKKLGLYKFASAVMYVLQKVFAMPDEYLLCQPNVEEGEFFLSEIMRGGNFGKYDEKRQGLPRGSHLTNFLSRLKFRFRLLRRYPLETLWSPVYDVYHFGKFEWMWWRKGYKSLRG